MITKLIVVNKLDASYEIKRLFWRGVLFSIISRNSKQPAKNQNSNHTLWSLSRSNIHTRKQNQTKPYFEFLEIMENKNTLANSLFRRGNFISIISRKRKQPYDIGIQNNNKSYHWNIAFTQVLQIL
jgi:hypothetical protein